MILVSPQYNVTGVGSPGSSTDRALATWSGTSGASLRSNSTVLISSTNTLDLSGADLRFTDNTYNIGVSKGQNTNNSTDYRPNHIFLKGAVFAGAWLGFNVPYGLNTSSFPGLIFAGNTNVTNVGAFMGTTNVLNGVAQSFYAFGKDNSFSNSPAFVSLNSQTDFDVYFSNLHLSSARTDLLKFGGDGSLTFLQTSGANLSWNTAGAGDIGANNAPGSAEVAQVTCIADSSNSLRGTSFTINTTSTHYYVWFKVGGVGNDPSTADVGILVSLATNDSAGTVATKVNTALSAVAGTPFSVSQSSNALTITNTAIGAVADAADVDSGFGIAVTTQGVNPGFPAHGPGNIYSQTSVITPFLGMPDNSVNDSTNANSVTLGAGNKVGSGTGAGGSVSVLAGSSGAGNGGPLTMAAGDGVNGADVLLQSGNSFSGGGNGGNINVTAGNADVGGTAGNISFTAGSGGATQGNILLHVAGAGYVSADGPVRVASLGVGNSASASGPVGSVVKKIEVFDASGTSLGYIPVYSSIT